MLFYLGSSDHLNMISQNIPEPKYSHSQFESLVSPTGPVASVRKKNPADYDTSVPQRTVNFIFELDEQITEGTGNGQAGSGAEDMSQPKRTKNTTIEADNPFRSMILQESSEDPSWPNFSKQATIEHDNPFKDTVTQQQKPQNTWIWPKFTRKATSESDNPFRSMVTQQEQVKRSEDTQVKDTQVKHVEHELQKPSRPFRKMSYKEKLESRPQAKLPSETSPKHQEVTSLRHVKETVITSPDVASAAEKPTRPFRSLSYKEKLQSRHTYFTNYPNPPEIVVKSKKTLSADESSSFDVKSKEGIDKEKRVKMDEGTFNMKSKEDIDKEKRVKMDESSFNMKSKEGIDKEKRVKMDESSFDVKSKESMGKERRVKMDEGSFNMKSKEGIDKEKRVKMDESSFNMKSKEGIDKEKRVKMDESSFDVKSKESMGKERRVKMDEGSFNMKSKEGIDKEKRVKMDESSFDVKSKEGIDKEKRVKMDDGGKENAALEQADEKIESFNMKIDEEHIGYIDEDEEANNIVQTVEETGEHSIVHGDTVGTHILQGEIPKTGILEQIVLPGKMSSAPDVAVSESYHNIETISCKRPEKISMVTPEDVHSQDELEGRPGQHKIVQREYEGVRKLEQSKTVDNKVQAMERSETEDAGTKNAVEHCGKVHENEIKDTQADNEVFFDAVQTQNKDSDEAELSIISDKEEAQVEGNVRERGRSRRREMDHRVINIKKYEVNLDEPKEVKTRKISMRKASRSRERRESCSPSRRTSHGPYLTVNPRRRSRSLSKSRQSLKSASEVTYEVEYLEVDLPDSEDKYVTLEQTEHFKGESDQEMDDISQRTRNKSKEILDLNDGNVFETSMEKQTKKIPRKRTRSMTLRYQCEVEGCSYGNYREDMVMSHMYSRHGVGLPHVFCEFCDKKYFSEA